MIVKESIRYDDPVLKLFKNNKTITVKEIDDEAEEFRFWASMMKKFGMSEEEIDQIFATSNCADEVAEKVFKAAGDTEQYALAFAESVHSPIMLEEKPNVNVMRSKVKSFLRERINSEVEDNLAIYVHASMPDYNPDWCHEEGFGDVVNALDKAQKEYVNALTNLLFANASKYVKEDYDEEASDFVLVIHEDETEFYEYYDQYEADAHIAELEQMDLDNPFNEGVIGYARLMRNDEGIVVVADKVCLYTDEAHNKKVDEAVAEYIYNNLDESCETIKTPRGEFKICKKFKSKEDAKKDGFGYYFTHDGKNIYTKSDDKHNTEVALVEEYDDDEEDRPKDARFGVRAWFNLKGCYDVFVFDFEEDATNFAERWKEAYDRWYKEYEDYEVRGITDAAVAEALNDALQPIIDSANNVDLYDECYYKQFEEKDGVLMFDDIEIVDSVDYGV